MAEDSGAAGAVADLATAPPSGDVQAATARKSELLSDPGFRDRYLSGNGEARTEMAALNATIAAAATPDAPNAQIAQFAVAYAKEFGVSEGVVNQIANREPVSQEEYEMVAQWKAGHLRDRAFVEKLNAGDFEARKKMFLANVVLASPIKPAAA